MFGITTNSVNYSWLSIYGSRYLPFGSQGGNQDIEPCNFPIDRCPIEIIQHIFEIVVDEADKYDHLSSHRIALILAQVSQYWRSVALNTPRLWAYIRLPLHRPSYVIDEYWERTLERIKGVPTEIYIFYSPLFHQFHCPSRWIGLKHIRSIHFDFESSKDLISILNDEFPAPQSSINELTIGVKVNPLNLINTGHQYDLSRLLYKWSPSLSITIRHIYTLDYGITMSPGFPLPATKTLQLDQSACYSTSLFAETFPNLTTLIMQQAKFYGDSIIELKPLTYLVLHDIDGRILGQLRCPNLSKFRVDGPAPLETSVLAFLRLHSTIQSFEYSELELTFAQIAVVAPQIQSISISTVLPQGMDILYDFSGKDFSSPPLPALRHLSISEGWKPTSLIEFDSIVRGRCLSQSHPKSLLPDTVQARIQTMSLRYMTAKVPEWLNSDLLQYAKRMETSYYQTELLEDVCLITVEWP